MAACLGPEGNVTTNKSITIYLQTHKDPVNYRYAAAFTLANDYGSKRLMSSYYFPDGATDQGPPSTDPGCGQDWVCEHRWKSIGKKSRLLLSTTANNLPNKS